MMWTQFTVFNFLLNSHCLIWKNVNEFSVTHDLVLPVRHTDSGNAADAVGKYHFEGENIQHGATEWATRLGNGPTKDFGCCQYHSDIEGIGCTAIDTWRSRLFGHRRWLDVFGPSDVELANRYPLHTIDCCWFLLRCPLRVHYHG